MDCKFDKNSRRRANAAYDHFVPVKAVMRIGFKQNGGGNL